MVLPVEAFQAIIEELKELEDIKQYDKAKKGKQEFINAEEAFKEIETKREQKQK